MIQFYGTQPPDLLRDIEIGGLCPRCLSVSRFSVRSYPSGDKLQREGAKELVVGYSCDACMAGLPVVWRINGWGPNNIPIVIDPRLMIPVLEDFEFDHVPDTVAADIKEALSCLSVDAFNGFAAMCRRAVQSICSDLGATGSSKVQKQVNEMLEMTGLDDEWGDLATQVMLTGHDGAHPHLPQVGPDRAAVLLSLIRDLTYQLYTRPGKVKEAALLRREAIGN